MNKPGHQPTKITKSTSKAVMGARWSLLGQWSRFLSQMLTVVILARLLSPEEYGLFSIVAAITGFAAVIGDFGLSSASIQAKEITTDQRSNLFWTNTAIGLTAGSILALAANAVGEFYGRLDAVPIVYAMSANFLLMSLTTQFAANVNRDMRFKLLFISDFFGPLIGLVTGVTIALLGGGPWALAGQQLATSVVVLLILAAGGRWVPSLPSKAPMRSLLAFGGKTFAVQVLNYSTINLGALLLGRFHSVRDAGFFDRAKQINGIPTTQLATPLTRVMLPVLSRAQENLGKLNHYLVRAEVLLAYVVGGVMVTVSVMSEVVVLVALGPGWGPVAPILSVLALGGYFVALGYVLQWGFMATGHVGVQLAFSIVTRLAMIALLLVAAPYGGLGIAAAFSAGLCINWLALFFGALPRTGLPISSLLTALVRPTALHASVVVVGHVLQHVLLADIESTARWSLTGASVLLIYLLTYALIKPIRADIKYIVATLVKRGER